MYIESVLISKGALCNDVLWDQLFSCSSHLWISKRIFNWANMRIKSSKCNQYPQQLESNSYRHSNYILLYGDLINLTVSADYYDYDRF